MTLMGYTSRNIPSPDVYAATIERRVKAKRAGDKATANALKLVLNTTYGAMLNRYNPLYDPLMGRSVCISGQLFLLELANHLVADCKTLKVIQLNTDGIMVSFDEDEYQKVLEITGEWQERTGFELEEDTVKSICQKDVTIMLRFPSRATLKSRAVFSFVELPRQERSTSTTTPAWLPRPSRIIWPTVSRSKIPS